MSSERSGAPWGTVLVLLILVAAAYVGLKPDAEDATEGPRTTVPAPPPDPLVRRSAGWAPVGRATITPGMQTFTDGGGQCTTNFVFSDAAGDVYLGQAAHCAGTDEQRNGCRAASRPLGTRVSLNRYGTPFDQGEVLADGTLAYSSWLTMQQRRERDAPTCAFNDFALVRLAPSARARVNPSMPFWGGPVGLSQRAVYATERVHGIGGSTLRRAGSPLAHQTGLALEDMAENDGWSHAFYARSPGIPGDSGSGYLDAEGRALGTLSTLVISTTLVNTLGDLRRELVYARRHSGIRGLRLELGTAPFDEERAAAPVR